MLLVVVALATLGLTPAGAARADSSTPSAVPSGTFVTTVSGTTVSVRATSVVDPSGRGASVCWEFGDRRTDGYGAATICPGGRYGTSFTHTYAASGTYTVVMHILGYFDVGSSAQKVTVPGQLTNQGPTASFTTSTSGSTVTVDGSASTDPDGTIAQWCWYVSHEQGAVCGGPLSTFTYPAAGLQGISLTTVDDKGGSTTVHRDVQVPAPPPSSTQLARDTFTRTVSGGWGAAETGGTWTVGGTASRYSVSSGTAAHRVPTAGTTLTSSLPGVQGTRTDSKVAVSVDKAATGGGVYVHVAGRRTSAGDYSARLKFNADKTVSLHLHRGSTALAGVASLGLTYTPGTQLRVRVQVVGSSPTTISAKAWKAGTTEPASWQVTKTDSTAGFQTAGSIGVSSYLSSTSTSAPVTVRFDNLTTTSP